MRRFMLREVPIYERPREKAIENGINSLSNVELLAILLRTGSKNEDVMQLSKRILYKIFSFIFIHIYFVDLLEIIFLQNTRKLLIKSTQK